MGSSRPQAVCQPSTDEREEYFRALRDADEQRFLSFINFTSQCTKNAVSLLKTSLEAAQFPEPEQSLQRLHAAYYVQNGLTHEQLYAHAQALLKKVQDGLATKLQALKKQEPVLDVVAWNNRDTAMFEVSQGMRCPRGFAAVQYTRLPPHSR